MEDLSAGWRNDFHFQGNIRLMVHTSPHFLVTTENLFKWYSWLLLYGENEHENGNKKRNENDCFPVWATVVMSHVHLSPESWIRLYRGYSLTINSKIIWFSAAHINWGSKLSHPSPLFFRDIFIKGLSSIQIDTISELSNKVIPKICTFFGWRTQPTWRRGGGDFKTSSLKDCWNMEFCHCWISVDILTEFQNRYHYFCI